MVLEEEVVFVSSPPYPSKDCTAHEIINIGPKSIDDLLSS
jgi:hypothetical protein